MLLLLRKLFLLLSLFVFHNDIIIVWSFHHPSTKCRSESSNQVLLQQQQQQQQQQQHHIIGSYFTLSKIHKSKSYIRRIHNDSNQRTTSTLFLRNIKTTDDDDEYNNNHSFEEEENENENENNSNSNSINMDRRNILSIIPSTIISIGICDMIPSHSSAMMMISDNNNNDVLLKQGTDIIYKRAIRPTAYRIDSTVPPTLIPLKNNRLQYITLQNLGRGYGTKKELLDTINLNNILNKVVFGTYETIQNTITSITDTSSDKDCTFVCLGLPTSVQSTDIDYTINNIISVMIDEALKRNDCSVGIGISCLPYSTQNMMNDYTAGIITDDTIFEQQLMNSGVSIANIELYRPVWQTIQKQYNNNKRNMKVNIIALAPDLEDCMIARTKGLQYISNDKRSQYVIDPTGFISQVNDPKFQLYTNRSLLKGYTTSTSTSSGNSNKNNKNKVDDDTSSGYFAEKILIHEAAASAVVKYAIAAKTSSCFITTLSPIEDVRFFNGLNGRISRISQYLVKQKKDRIIQEQQQQQQEQSSLSVLNNNNNNNNILDNVNDNSITTILLNPNAIETLSKTNYIRLEIGTGPDTIQYQMKIADYIWFTSSPKVNLLPRMMN